MSYKVLILYNHKLTIQAYYSNLILISAKYTFLRDFNIFLIDFLKFYSSYHVKKSDQTH